MRSFDRFKLFNFLDYLSLFISFLSLALLWSFLIAVTLDVFSDGLKRLGKDFFFSFPSRRPENAGIFSAWVGTLAVISVAFPFSFLLGVLGGIYLEEYAKRNIITRIIEVNINNLSAVPSIIYGLLAVGLFAQVMRFGESILTAGLTLGVLMLPIIVITTREAIRTVPPYIKEASYSLGSTKWETIKHHVLPYSFPGIITGVIIALSRAIGETAPLITVGALTFISFLPPSPLKPEFPFLSFEWLKSPFTVLPIQMFNWVSRPQKAFHYNAAATGVVLISITFILIIIASIIRYRFRKRVISL
ncbi:Phosphate transport system permease protein PstA [bacterium HR19]|nr:Phosphate transport system permease protein PstA [bacterium HR19]